MYECRDLTGRRWNWVLLTVGGHVVWRVTARAVCIQVFAVSIFVMVLRYRSWVLMTV